MKIYAFKVQTDTSETLDSLLSAIKQLPIVDRVRDTSSGEVSLKEMRRSKNGNWLLDFTKFR